MPQDYLLFTVIQSEQVQVLNVPVDCHQLAVEIDLHCSCSQSYTKETTQPTLVELKMFALSSWRVLLFLLQTFLLLTNLEGRFATYTQIN